MKKILIAVPCYSYTQPLTMESIYSLVIPTDCITELKFIAGYTVAQARNRLVQYSIDNNFDYTFFVDSDIILPKDTLNKLFELNVPIATAWYIKKMEGDGITELYNPIKDSSQLGNIMENDLPKDSLIQIEACGFGCTLVDNKVFNSMSKSHWFEYMDKPEFICSEDINFCIKVNNLKYNIICDTSLRCNHIGQKIY